MLAVAVGLRIRDSKGALGDSEVGWGSGEDGGKERIVGGGLRHWGGNKRISRLRCEVGTDVCRRAWRSRRKTRLAGEVRVWVRSTETVAAAVGRQRRGAARREGPSWLEPLRVAESLDLAHIQSGGNRAGRAPPRR